MKRKIFDSLVKWQKQTLRKPLILRGVRQVGKTYILKQFGKTCFPRYHYVNFEKSDTLFKIFDHDLNPSRIIEDLRFYLDTDIDISKDLVIFDEIQECPRALTSLKYFHEEMEELALCCAGSLLGIHLNSTSYPVGQVDLLSLYPMSFEEFLMAIGDIKSINILENLHQSSTISDIVHEHLWEQLKRFFVVGGMPEAVATYCRYPDDLYKAFTEVRQKQDALLVTYLADIAKHSGKTNSMHIERVFRSASVQLSSVHEGSATKFKFKGVIPNINGYERMVNAIDWLEAAGLVLKVLIANTGNVPIKAYTKENTFKLFLFDIGMLGSLVEISPKVIMDYDYGSYKGFFAENFVAQEFLCAGSTSLYSWQENRSELEFLREVDGHAMPIGVKSGRVTHAKSLKVFCDKYHPKYGVIISAKPLSFNLDKQVQYLPLYAAGRFPLV